MVVPYSDSPMASFVQLSKMSVAQMFTYTARVTAVVPYFGYARAGRWPPASA